MTGLQPSHHGIQTNTRGYRCRVHDLPDTPELLSRHLMLRETPAPARVS